MKRFLTAIVCLATAVACHSDSVTGPSASLTTPTCGPAALVELSPNQATTLACSSGTYINLAGNAKYLIVPQFAGGGLSSGLSDSPVSYQIGVAASTSTSASIAGGALDEAPWHLSLQQQLDQRLRARERQMLATGQWKAARSTALSRELSASGAVVPDVGSLRDFRVLAGAGLQSFTTITATARLSFVGQNILLYIDTLAPANGFTAAQLQAFGQYFDQTLYGLAVSAFGPPSDIDANAHVIMLLSPSVNELTPTSQCQTQGFVAGYFDGTDLASNGSDSNRGEIFYAVVPDPTGKVSCAHSVAGLLGTVPGTFLHELQHLISFSQHVVVHGGQDEEGWLDEGLSIRAEELGSEYFEAKFPPPSGRSNPAQLFPDSSQGFVANFLSDSTPICCAPTPRASRCTPTLTMDSRGAEVIGCSCIGSET
jgi:hypothetical protein